MYETITTKSLTCHPVGDQKQIFGGIGQDHVQKLGAWIAFRLPVDIVDSFVGPPFRHNTPLRIDTW
jgi:hypothetical protein